MCESLDPKLSMPEGVVVEGKGYCFFRAIAVAIGTEDIEQKSLEVRREVADARKNDQ